MKIPQELLKKLVEVEAEVEAWSAKAKLSEGIGENDHEVFKSVINLQNAINGLVLDDEYGDEQYVRLLAPRPFRSLLSPSFIDCGLLPTIYDQEFGETCQTGR